MSKIGVRRITLDLTGRADVPRIEGREFTNFIQQEAFHRLRTILKTRLDDAKANGSQHTQGILRDRSHNAIAILGGRGSGKTTFILNALDLLTTYPSGEGRLAARAVSLPALAPVQAPWFARVREVVSWGGLRF